MKNIGKLFGNFTRSISSRILGKQYFLEKDLAKHLKEGRTILYVTKQKPEEIKEKFKNRFNIDIDVKWVYNDAYHLTLSKNE
jgi:KaiC/GvpD/RAD55 family RecA-like ATPase